MNLTSWLDMLTETTLTWLLGGGDQWIFCILIVGVCVPGVGEGLGEGGDIATLSWLK
jgi:hypothetical protein